MTEKNTAKILCVDDEENILHMFRRTIGRDYSLYTANSGESGLKILSENKDIAVILSDFNMPGINGLEFLKQARELSPDAVEIMLTGNIELDVAINAINETDIFRYLPKPCPMDTLRKVITDALKQYYLLTEKLRLTKKLEQSNQELLKQRYLLEHELEMAKIVYSKANALAPIQPYGLDFHIAAKETVGGDFILTHNSEDGLTFYLMMGDLTGHGLQSALAVLLVNEVFDVLCLTQPSVEDFAQNINEKMCRKLPTGLFCAATLVKLDFISQQLHLWQGGLPDAFLLGKQGQVLKTLHSNNLPLGVLAEQSFAGTSSCHAFDSATSLFIYSDGVIEQIGPEQTMFGIENLLATLQNTQLNTRRVDQVMTALLNHQQHEPQSDDISLAELNFRHLSNLKKISTWSI
jgi:serine phosphatase RsbU (regulator of sigma subunit)